MYQNQGIKGIEYNDFKDYRCPYGEKSGCGVIDCYGDTTELKARRKIIESDRTSTINQKKSENLLTIILRDFNGK